MSTSVRQFDLLEYAVFGFMLAISMLIGIYYGCYKKNQNSISEYLLGGKSMTVIPVTLSLFASHISGIAIIGVPAEVYVYGTQFLAVCFCSMIVVAFVTLFYIPVFHPLQLNSFFKYLELRFNNNVRILASLIFSLGLVLHISVIIYISAMAFTQVSGVSIHLVASVVSLICIFYTTLGGLKAVVWTDAIQSFFIFLSTLVIAIFGCLDVGGFLQVFETASEGHRLELFNMDPNPFARHTFWTMVIGCTFTLLSYQAVSPGTIQRFIAVPSQSDAKKVMFWSGIGFIVIHILTVFIGLILYVKYHDCDPLTTKVVKKSVQLLPMYVMEIGNRIPGFSGLFIAGVFSAGLSTMSTGLNIVSGTIYEDFVLLLYRRSHSEATASFIMKLTVVIFGIISVLLIFVVDKLGGVLQMALSLLGITHGTLFSLFTLGMFFPWANTKGAITGTVTSLIAMSWIVVGAQTSIAEGRLKFPGKIVTVDSCPSSYHTENNGTVPSYTGVGSPVAADPSVPYIYQLSYLYYNLLGTLIGLITGITVSFLTGVQKPSDVSPDLLVPQIRKFLPKHTKDLQMSPEQHA